jgi:NTP pyrophosphatase (non-canonical NTP hydrolase)
MAVKKEYDYDYMDETIDIALPEERTEGIKVFYIKNGGCMANDAPYYKASKGNDLGIGSRREEAILNLREVINHKSLQNSLHPLNVLSRRCREANDTWWRDTTTGEKIERNKGELIALIHSEISECLEGERKSLMDDHLPHRRMAEVELADALIRIFDYAGEYGYDLGSAFEEKMKYNAERVDHKPESRIKLDGKKF